jgi:hypothetical protein
MSWKASIRTYGDPKYYDNAVRFATRTEADWYGSDLSSRWTQAEHYKVGKSTDPVNYRIDDGKLVRIEENPDSHTQVTVPKLPKCDFCDERALYDGKTTVGPWGYMCRKHFREYGTGLGLGKGQKLIPKRNPHNEYDRGWPMFFDGKEYRNIAWGLSKRDAQKEAARWMRDQFSAKITGSMILGYSVWVRRPDMGANPTIGQWAKKLYVMKGKKFAAHIVSQGPHLTKLQLITHKGTLSRPITIETGRLMKEFYVARDNPISSNPSPYRCKRCGGEIGIGSVLKYVGKKGPYHEWCAALVRGKGKVQKWDNPGRPHTKRNPQLPSTLCRCCGKPVGFTGDDYPIHTKCIPKHWGKHAKGINFSRCKEFQHSWRR